MGGDFQPYGAPGRRRPLLPFGTRHDNLCTGNLYRMGGYRSFREIVDKYLCFPRFKVEYIGAEGRKIYTTQQELMDAVHAMNPDGPSHEPKQYEHPLPDDIFEELKAETPNMTWHEKPSIILQYYPLDWYSDSGNISGFGVKATPKENMFLESFEIDFQLICRISSEVFIGFSSQFTSLKNITETTLASWVRKDGCSVFPAWDVQAFMDFPCISAYNDVLVGTFEHYDSPFCASGLLPFARVLFTGQYAPEIAMDRNEISSFPLEAALELSVIAHETGLFDRLSIKWNQATTRALRELFQKHPAWEKYVKINGVNGDLFSLPEIRDIFSQNAHAKILFNIYDDAYSALCLTAICRKYAVCIDTTGKNRLWGLTITNAPPDDTAIDFPGRMFFPPVKENAPLCFDFGFGRYYNQEHRFSQWLIQNQAELQERVPGIYNDIIALMLMPRNSFIADINAILTQLRGYRNNYFNITDELFLTDADIVEIKEGEDE